MIYTGEFLGDSRGETFNNVSVVITATLLVVGSYYVLLSPVFRFIDRIKVKQISHRIPDKIIGARIGYLLFVLQCCFWLNSALHGLNIAGAGNIKGGSQALSYFFVMVDPDFLFFIYYGIYRENKTFYPNLLVYILSNISRAWVGMFIFVLFFEGCRLYRKKSLSVKKIIIGVLIVLVSYPAISNLKWIIRSQSFSGVNYGEAIETIKHEFDSTRYLDSISASFDQAIERLQVVSLLVKVIDIKSNLQTDLDTSKFLPFWLEGLHGIIFDRIVYGSERMPVGVIMVKYLHPNSQFEGVGNTNISYPGWFYISPMTSHFYVLYSMFLGFLSMYFVKKIKNNESSRDMVWLIWLMYLLPPWLGAVVKIIYSAIIFLIMTIILSNIRGVSFSIGRTRPGKYTLSLANGNHLD